MNRPNSPHPPPLLEHITTAYPEETRFLGQIFDDTTTSYKYFWFLALLSLIRRTQRYSFPLSEISTEMAVVAWHPVNLFRLSLEELRRIPDARKDFLIKKKARESQQTARPSLYFFEGDPQAEVITLSKAWRFFLVENIGVVQHFAEYALAQYLQARNPNVPGIINKVRAPTPNDRNLGSARRHLRAIRAALVHVGRAACFQDIYTGHPLAADFSIDHFLPWSFVAHNQFWNLVPVALSVNSSKGDSLPHLGLYLPRLAQFHFAAIGTAKYSARFLEDYADCFREDIPGLLALGEAGFVGKYRELIEPQELIARNLGFRSGWQPAP